MIHKENGKNLQSKLGEKNRKKIIASKWRKIAGFDKVKSHKTQNFSK